MQYFLDVISQKCNYFYFINVIFRCVGGQRSHGVSVHVMKLNMNSFF